MLVAAREYRAYPHHSWRLMWSPISRLAAETLTSRRSLGSGNHGKESRKFNQDCTI